MMKNLLALGAAGLIAFVVVGWFLGWYKVEKTGNEIKVDFNTPKITHDINQGKAKLEGILTKQPNTTNPAPVSAPPPLPSTGTSPGHVTIVPVTAPDGSFVLPGNPDASNQGPVVLPPVSSPPPLPPR